MRPKLPKIASLDQKICFSSLVHSLLPKDNLFKNILNEIIFVYIPQETMFSLLAAVIIHKRVEPVLCPTEFQT